MTNQLLHDLFETARCLGVAQAGTDDNAAWWWTKKSREALERLKNMTPTPIAVIKRNEAGQIYLSSLEGEHFDMSRYVGQTLYIM